MVKKRLKIKTRKEAMPELPEVETVRRGLEEQIVGKTIESVKVTYPKLVRTGLEDFQLLLPGQSVQAMRRRGKYLIFELTGGLVISHLRMEGKYFLFSDQVPTNKHFHAFFTFTDGTTLVYQDVRKFGTMEYLPKSQEATYFLSKKLGPEPTKETFKLAPFERTLVKSHRPIKSYLLDQSLVAGLGNIYADEVLWAAKVHPERRSDSLRPAEIKRLHDQTIRILQEGIKRGGSTIRTYKNTLGEDGTMQDFLEVYGCEGELCSRCGSTIEKIKVGGRGSHYCPKCQKK